MKITEPKSKLISENLLELETIKNGYLVIDSKTATIVLKLLKTSDKNIFIAISNQKNGVVVKKEKDVFFEYYNENNFVSEKLNISLD